jgi:hypothetical protein
MASAGEARKNYAALKNMQVTIKYGIQQITKTLRDGATISGLLSDPSVKAVLGFGDNVRALIDGQEMDGSAELSEGDFVVIETRANKKA